MTVIDFHSHILPKADHGCDSQSEAIIQLKLLKKAGVDIVVATSHFYPNRHTVTDFKQLTKTSLDDILSSNLSDRPRIAIGAEVLIFENIDRMEGIEELCIEGTRVMLIEMPMTDTWSNGLFETINRLLKKDFTVVLAHIDRYLPSHKEDIEYLLDIGAYAQINAKAFKRFLFKKHLDPFLSDDRLVAFGSDLHKEDTKAVSSFAELKRLKDNVFERIMERTEEIIKDAKLY